ncbi:MAG: hypothetical protein ABEI39_01180 [Halobacteriales archaeon]
MSQSARPGAVLAALLLFLAAAAPAGATLHDPLTAEAPPTPDTHLPPVEVGPPAPLDSGATYWQGWGLRFDGSRLVGDPGNASRANRTFGLWRVDRDGDLEGRIRRFVVNRSGLATLGTASITGRFVVRYRGEPVSVRGGVGTRPPDGASLADSAFRVVEQRLDATLSEPTVYRSQLTRLRFASNRSNYTVLVTSPDLGRGALRDLFRPGVVVESDREDAVVLRGERDVEYILNASGLEPGTYDLRFDVPDTTADAGSLLRLQRRAEGLRIGAIERGEDAGDHVNVTVLGCSDCRLVVGGQGAPFLDVVNLTDRDGDEAVTVRINTRYMGMAPSTPGVGAGRGPYRALGPDIASRYAPERIVSPPYRLVKYSLARVRTSLGLAAAGRDAAVAPGVFDVTVAEGDTLIDYLRRDPLVVPTERDAGSVTLRRPALEGIRVSPAPPGLPWTYTHNATPPDPSPSTVALGDRLVVRIDVSGVFGYLAARHGSRVLRSLPRGLDVGLREVSGAPNPNTVDLSESRIAVLRDERRDRLYVVLDTRRISADRPLAPGEFLVSVGIDPDADAYPALRGSEPRTAEIRLVEARATIESVEPVPGRRALRISGTTTVAAGTTVDVEAAAGGYGWETASGVVVGSDGTWSTVLGFDDAPGQRYTVTVSRNGVTLARRPGVRPGIDTPVGGVTDSASPVPSPTPGSPVPASPTVPPPTSPPGTTTPASPPATPTPGSVDGGPVATPVPAGPPFVPDLPDLPAGSPGPVLLALVLAAAGLVVAGRGR